MVFTVGFDVEYFGHQSHQNLATPAYTQLFAGHAWASTDVAEFATLDAEYLGAFLFHPYYFWNNWRVALQGHVQE